MQPPTHAEIQLGYEGITADGQNAPITAALSLAAATSPQIKDTLERMVRASLGMGLLQGNRAEIYAVLSGALIYGLHLGLHIGESRTGIRS